MRAEPARQGGVSPPKVQLLRDVDLHELFPPTCAANKNAIALIGVLKARANGKGFIVVKDSVLADWLGWSKATVKRAKRTIREAGIPVAGVTAYRRPDGDSRGEEFTATRWVLDRRWVPALRDEPSLSSDVEKQEPRDVGEGSKLSPHVGAENRDEGVGSEQTPTLQKVPQVGSIVTPPLKGPENVRAEEAASPSSLSPDSHRHNARPPPAVDASSRDGDDGDIVPQLRLEAPPEPQGGREPPPLATLVQLLWRELEAESGADGARLADRLRKAAGLACDAPFLVELALQRLAAELRECGRHRLAVALTRPRDGEASGRADADSRRQES